MDKVANDDFSSQLRSLRLILGKNFRPISTKTLASLSGIALVSIRAVEAGRRRLSELDRWTIQLQLGTTWNVESGQWVSARDQMPYTREKYESHIDRFMHSSEPEQLRANYHKTVDEYLDRLEPTKRRFILAKLYRSFAQIAQQERSSSVAQVEKEIIPLLNSFQIPAPAFDKSLTKQRLLRSLKQKKAPPSRP